MSSAYQINFIFSIEFFNNVATKQISCTSWTHTPASWIIWVTPHQIAHGAIMWYFLFSINWSDVIKGADWWTQPTMYTKNLVIYNSRQSKIIENWCAISPYIYRSIFSEALIIKTIHLGNLSTFVISSNQCYSFRISYFKSQQQQKCFDWVISTINEITHEKVVCIWAFATNFKKFF